MEKDLKEEVFGIFAELTDPESVEDVCIPDCKLIFEAGPVYYGQIALKRCAGKVFGHASKMGMNEFRISNFKEGGTPQEPRCEFLLAIHDGKGFIYRKGKARFAFKRVQGNLRVQSHEWAFDDLQRINWNI